MPLKHSLGASRRHRGDHPLSSVHTSLTVRCRSGSAGRPNAAVRSPQFTEPPSICKRCMSRWGEDGRKALCTYKMPGDSRRKVVKTAEGACKASMHAVVAVRDRRRYHFLNAWSVLARAKLQLPSTKRSDLATPVNDHVVSASRQLTTTSCRDLVWLDDDRQLETAGTGPSNRAVDMPCMGQSAP